MGNGDIRKKGDRERARKKIVKEIVSENSSNLMKNNLHI